MCSIFKDENNNLFGCLDCFLDKYCMCGISVPRTFIAFKEDLKTSLHFAEIKNYGINLRLLYEFLLIKEKLCAKRPQVTSVGYGSWGCCYSCILGHQAGCPKDLSENAMDLAEKGYSVCTYRLW